MRNHLIRSLVVCGIVLLGSSAASAQYQQQNRVTQLGNQSGFRTTQSQILGRPTVSPYLALTDLTGSGQIDTSRNYFTQVRPQLEYRQRQQQQQRSIQQVQRQVTQLRSMAAAQSQGGPRGTGHPTRFNFLMHYYPGLGR